MQKIHLLPIVFFALVLSLPSCTIEKRLYNSGYSVQRNSTHFSSEKVEENPTLDEVKSVRGINDGLRDSNKQTQNLIPESEVNTNSALENCDSIVFKDGTVKEAIVTIVGTDEIHYKNCDGSGPEYVERKSNVSKIRYASGKRESFSVVEPSKTATNPTPENSTATVDAFGVIGFFSSILGIFFAGIPLGILAIIFGIVSIARITEHPSKHKGIAFGILSLIFGLIVLILTIALLV